MDLVDCDNQRTLFRQGPKKAGYDGSVGPRRSFRPKCPSTENRCLKSHLDRRSRTPQQSVRQHPHQVTGTRQLPRREPNQIDAGPCILLQPHQQCRLSTSPRPGQHNDMRIWLPRIQPPYLHSELFLDIIAPCKLWRESAETRPKRILTIADFHAVFPLLHLTLPFAIRRSGSRCDEPESLASRALTS